MINNCFFIQLYFASSLISFYLPYDYCLDEELNGIAPHALRLFAPLTALIISFTLLGMINYNIWCENNLFIAALQFFFIIIMQVL